MRKNNQVKGKSGEDLAVKYLKKKRYKIVERNYRKGTAEIDIIALKENILCFVEVKTRESLKYGRPSEAVNIYRQKRYINSAKIYIAQHGNNFDIRFDVIEVLNNEITHLIDAFRG